MGALLAIVARNAIAVQRELQLIADGLPVDWERRAVAMSASSTLYCVSFVSWKSTCCSFSREQLRFSMLWQLQQQQLRPLQASQQTSSYRHPRRIKMCVYFACGTCHSDSQCTFAHSLGEFKEALDLSLWSAGAMTSTVPSITCRRRCGPLRVYTQKPFACSMTV